jgi:hypothetical protein
MLRGLPPGLESVSLDIVPAGRLNPAGGGLR